MNELDLKLCEMFPSENRKRMTENIYEIWTPELHDVFRLAKEKLWIWYGFWWSYITDYQWDSIFPYDPTLPLLNQSDETKKALISLFE